MKMSTDLEKKFNNQITNEIAASNVYRQLAIRADELDLVGMASWLRQQADEEISHANKFIDHLLDRGNHPEIGNVPAPAVGPELNAVQIFAQAAEHEKGVSESIRELWRAAEAEGDLDARPLLSWFLDEQVTEEATVSEIVGRLSMIGSDGAGLLRLDSELGDRPRASTGA